MRRIGSDLIVNAQLIDGRDGQHLWADRADIGAGDIIALQVALVRRIAATTTSGVRHAERAAGLRSAPGSLDVYVLTQRGAACERLRRYISDLLAQAPALRLSVPMLAPYFARDPQRRQTWPLRLREAGMADRRKSQGAPPQPMQRTFRAIRLERVPARRGFALRHVAKRQVGALAST